MSSANEASTGLADLHVVFRVADADFAVPATDVVQMESYVGVTAVPGVAPWIAGLTQIRGRVVPILDVRRRFGLPSVPPPPSARIIVVSVGQRSVGLLVDVAREVTKLDGEIGPPPELLTHTAQGFVRGVARSKGRLLMLIDTGRLIGDPIDPVDRTRREEPRHGG
jgi:purine-binding chemotaxis protein CheW